MTSPIGERKSMRSVVMKAKVCLVGEAAVGKTSLIRRFVLDEYDDRYETTLGAKVTKKELHIPIKEKRLEVQLDMTIWDVMGDETFRELLRKAYFAGSRGVLAVADLTRRSTLDGVSGWIDAVGKVVMRVPVLIAVNKADLEANAEFSQDEIRKVAEGCGAEFLMTSAKTGAGVERAFQRLGALIAWGQFGGFLDEGE